MSVFTCWKVICLYFSSFHFVAVDVVIVALFVNVIMQSSVQNFYSFCPLFAHFLYLHHQFLNCQLIVINLLSGFVLGKNYVRVEVKAFS